MILRAQTSACTSLAPPGHEAATGLLNAKNFAYPSRESACSSHAAESREEICDTSTRPETAARPKQLHACTVLNVWNRITLALPSEALLGRRYQNATCLFVSLFALLLCSDYTHFMRFPNMVILSHDSISRAFRNHSRSSLDSQLNSMLHPNMIFCIECMRCLKSDSVGTKV